MLANWLHDTVSITSMFKGSVSKTFNKNIAANNYFLCKDIADVQYVLQSVWVSLFLVRVSVPDTKSKNRGLWQGQRWEQGTGRLAMGTTGSNPEQTAVPQNIHKVVTGSVTFFTACHLRGKSQWVSPVFTCFPSLITDPILIWFHRDGKTYGWFKSSSLTMSRLFFSPHSVLIHYWSYDDVI